MNKISQKYYARSDELSFIAAEQAVNLECRALISRIHAERSTKVISCDGKSIAFNVSQNEVLTVYYTNHITTPDGEILKWTLRNGIIHEMHCMKHEMMKAKLFSCPVNDICINSLYRILKTL